MRNCKLTGKALVVQISQEETRIALMKLGASNRKILDSVVVPTPENEVEDGFIHNVKNMRSVLMDVRKMKNFMQTRKVVFSLCTSQVISETVAIPDVPQKQLERLLMANMDVYFPVDREEYEIAWQSVGTKLNSSGNLERLIQLWAIPREMLSRYYKLANACGLSVVAVDYYGHAVATAIGATFVLNAKGEKGLQLELGAAAQEKRSAQAAQEAEELEKRLMETPVQLHLTLEKNHVLTTFVQDGKVRLQRMISCSHPSESISEIIMVREYFTSLGASYRDPSNLQFSGSLAEDVALTAELSDQLGLTGTMALPNTAPAWISCIGASATNLDFGLFEMNKRNTSAAKRLGSTLQYAAVLGAGALLLASVFNLLGSRLSWEQVLSRLESTRKTLYMQWTQNQGAYDAYNKYAGIYDKYNNDWNKIFGSIQTYNDNVVLVLEELEKVLPEDATVKQLEISQEGMSIQFACKDKETAANLILALRGLKYASLDSISNLTGGGGGPYKPSASPTVTFTLSNREIFAQMQNNVDERELFNQVVVLGSATVETFESKYGTKPAGINTSEVLTALQTAENFFLRKAALEKMCYTNPFAANIFLRLVRADVKGGASQTILGPYIAAAMNEDPANAEMFVALSQMDTKPITPAQLEGYLPRLLAIVTKNNASLSDTERVMAKDADLQRWYAYYLLVENNERSYEKLVYLDATKVGNAVTNNTWPGTGNSALDVVLRTYLPAPAGSGGGGGGGTTPPDNPNPGTGNAIPEAYWKLALQQLGFPNSDVPAPTNVPDDVYYDTITWVANGCVGKPSDATMAWYTNYYLQNSQLPNIPSNPGGSGGGGSSGGGSSSGKDTNVYVTVTLGYRQELIQEELDRKGLDQTEKLDKVEVENK